MTCFGAWRRARGIAEQNGPAGGRAHRRSPLTSTPTFRRAGRVPRARSGLRRLREGRRELAPPWNVELAIAAPQVGLDRLHRDEQALGDLCVGHPAGREL